MRSGKTDEWIFVDFIGEMAVILKNERESDFPPTSLARLEALPQTDIAWFDPGRHPAQGMIAISDSAAGAIGTIRDDAFTAISVVSDSTGNALGKSYQKAIHAIGNSARRVGSVLRRQPDPE